MMSFALVCPRRRFVANLAIVAAMMFCAACRGESSVEIVLENGRYSLVRNGEPYQVKGAGAKFDSLDRVAAHGGNSIRTWGTGNAHQILDRAQELGLTVVMCIGVGHERHGFDYDNKDAVAEQLELARREVLEHKEHPALLAWMIGNEPNFSFKNPKVFDAVNEISQMIHEVDGKHPTTVALTGFSAELARLIDARAPDLDFLSIQMYGDIVNLPRYLDEFEFKRPLMVTEWGAIGHWEVAKTDWGAPIEQNSSEKANNYRRGYETVIASNAAQILGGYVFFWGQKQERTPTWYGMFLGDGSETETIDVMHYIWNGAWPDNRSPQIKSVTLDSKTSRDSVVLKSATRYEAQMDAVDLDGDELEYRWELMRESMATEEGGDAEQVPDLVGGRIDNPSQRRIVVDAPPEPGAYRLFVYVYDGNDNAGHANIPFLVR